MLYQKNTASKLDAQLFQDPTSEYRGAPFWAWNASLNQKKLEQQIDIFKEMGFGGFHMHVRQGLEVPYLSDEFLQAVKCCVSKAKKEEMFAWLYDEDRWPSGYAGGLVTKHKKYRQKFLLMSKQDRDTQDNKAKALEEGKAFFLAAFDVRLNQAGEMLSYRKVGREEAADHKWYFFVCSKQGGEAGYNDQCYVDTMSKEAIDEFIRITYEAFREKAGEDFGKAIPAIFSDEPNVMFPTLLSSGFSEKDARFCWTFDFDETYKAAYGEDIIDKLPEIAFAMAEPADLTVRYRYYCHIAERFAEAYMDNVGKWCGKNSLMFTGHLMGEDSLYTASSWMGDAMRMYKEMQLPGIDMLFDNRAYVTAKQCQSVVHQYGREGMLSELYGVTGWDFDFRGHKLQGDWQACLGVTVRVPHLAWQTMRGEGKRDYPASIFYQSPWYQKYKLLEDHFARVNTAMTRGKAVVKTAVLHPIESYWLLRGSHAETWAEREEMDAHFGELAEWLLFGHTDFDYMAESLLADLCQEVGNPLPVGQMKYDTLIVEDCITLRPYTIRVLKEFMEKGGQVIFMGKTPKLCLGQPSFEAEQLSGYGEVISHSKADLYRKLREGQDIRIKKTDGTTAKGLIYQMREDGEDRWLFIANAGKPELAHVSEKQEVCITVRGKYKPVEYDTLTGNIQEISFRYDSHDNTLIYKSMYSHDSLLLKLENSDTCEECLQTWEKDYDFEMELNSAADYTMEEANVLVLDMAQYSVDDQPLQNTEEILRIDEAVRAALGLRTRKNKVIQPWAIAGEPEDHRVKLVFSIESEISYASPVLAMENLQKAHIVWNGESVEALPSGWYVDRYIETVDLPKLRKGRNQLEITIPFGLRTDLENCYLLGNFGVAYAGRKVWLTRLPEQLQYGSVVNQGMSFYGGNIQYHSQITLDEDGDIELEASYYKGALIEVLVDGERKGHIIFAPYRLAIKNLSKGTHKVTFILYGNRYNTFSALHTLVADKAGIRIGPDYWRSEGDKWSYEYQTRPMGILKTPICRVRYLRSRGKILC